MMGRRRQFAAFLAFAAASSERSVVASSEAPPASEAQLPHVEMELKSAACEPSEITTPAGRVAFTVRNATPVAQEWEILDGVMVIEERENIPPGASRSLIARLLPGDYAITCGLISNPKGALHVTGRRGDIEKVRRAEIVGPLAEYRVFVSEELDSLVDVMSRLDAAVAAGQLDEARQLYLEAHAHYVRISPIAIYFPDLDGAVDPKLDARALAKADAGYLGFNELGWALFDAGDAELAAGVLNKLSADVAGMQARFENLSMTPAPTIAGAAQAMGAASLAESRGWRRRLALSDFRANVEGVRKLSDLFGALIARADAKLDQALKEDFATLDAAFARIQSDALTVADMHRDADLALVKKLVEKLSVELGRAPGALGLG